MSLSKEEQNIMDLWNDFENSLEEAVKNDDEDKKKVPMPPPS